MRDNRTPCDACPLRRKDHFRDFSDSELDFVKSFKTGELTVDKGTAVLLQGAHNAHIYTVLDGWAMRHVTLADGRRQVLNYALPGDMVGLQASLFDEMHHTVEALSDLTLCVFSRDELWNLFATHPGLAFDMTWLVTQEEKLIGDHLVSVGRRSAEERIAYPVWHLFTRARSRDMSDGRKLALPLTQQHFADTLGLSLVHINKTLRKLQDKGLFRLSNSQVEVPDLDALNEFTAAPAVEFSPRPFI